MRATLVASFFFWLVTCILFLQVNAQEYHWGYRKENGPKTWPGTCASGSHQSPVNIENPKVMIQTMGQLYFGNYEGGEEVTLLNDGHTLKIHGFEKWKNRPYITEGPLPTKYNLLQIHFHWGNNDSNGSEHSIDWIYHPAEIHFVHEKEGDKNSTDHLAVIGSFLHVDDDGDAFSEIEPLLKNVVTFNTSAQIKSYTPSNMLPSNLRKFYTYHGSLTTPTCDEIVVWILMPTLISITKSQLQLLRNIQADDGKVFDCNCRPAQSLNGRQIGYRDSSIWDNFSGYTISWIIAVSVLLIFFAALLVRWWKNRQQLTREPTSSETEALLEH
ncbi:Carbonic anhydrase [Aphelenchoides bicaudatus]|nr:Carbonic anhydrase [Aphelenchoides bicaudatus]